MKKAILYILCLILTFCVIVPIKADENEKTNESEGVIETVTQENVCKVTFIDDVRKTNIVKYVEWGECVNEEKVSSDIVPVDNDSYCFFKEWTITNGEKTKRFDFNTPIEGDIVLNAKYLYSLYPDERDNRLYIIKFDSQGGTSVGKQYLEYGDLVKEPKVPMREGYEFLGWYDKKNGGEKWDFNKNKVEAYTVKLYAHWQYIGEDNNANISPKTGYEIRNLFVMFIFSLGIVAFSVIRVIKVERNIRNIVRSK